MTVPANGQPQTAPSLANVKVAILVANGFLEAQFTAAQRALLKAEAKVTVVSPQIGVVQGWLDGWGHYFPTDKLIAETLAADFDLLLIPGGPAHVKKLESTPHTKRLLTAFLDGQKRTVLMDEAVELLIHAERARDRNVAAAGALAERLAAAGAVVASEGAPVADYALMTLVVGEGLEPALQAAVAFLAGQNAAADEAA